MCVGGGVCGGMGAWGHGGVGRGSPSFLLQPTLLNFMYNNMITLRPLYSVVNLYLKQQ